MKKNIKILAVFALLFGLVGPALAVDETSSPSPRKTPSTERRDAAKERLTDNRKQQIKKWWTRNAQRLARIIERESKMADKINEKLEKAARNGKDVSAARAKLIDARAKIAAAAQALRDATAQVDGIIANNKPSEAFRKLHELNKTVTNAIREAHKALVDVLVTLRGVGAKPTRSPSPSPSASPSASPSPTSS